MVERALLVTIWFRGQDQDEAASLLLELEDLVRTLGVPIQDRMLVACAQPRPRLLVGTGKAEEILRRAREINADVIVIDNDLTPAQQRSWERLTGLCVIDREEVILDIFGNRALTREARLQVDLARMQYSLPRLTRAWTHLSRQSGGGGTGGRGEGETQLEADRRMVRRRIDRLKIELVAVRKHRATQRKNRLRIPLPHAAIVGYTNAGKSSLLRCLTGADVHVEDKLFATLDTTTRKVKLPDGQFLLLTDTVGFVRRLPHDLVESFKATLEEAVLADFRIHVLDASHPKVTEFYRTTVDVLEELGADTSNMVTVFNKLDLVEDRSRLLALRNEFPDALFVSAHTREGIEGLEHRLADLLHSLVMHLEYRVPQSRSDLVSAIYDSGKVLEARYDDDEVHLVAIMPSRLRSRFQKFEADGEALELPADIPDPEADILTA